MRKFIAALALFFALPAAAQIPGGAEIQVNRTPITGGTSGLCLYQTSAGKVGEQACGTGTATDIKVGTTTVSSGTTTRILYDNAGTLGEYTLTGSGTVVVMQTSPSLITPALGVATATSLNGLTVSTTTGTLTLVNGSSLITAGAFPITFTSTGSTGVTLPTTGTLAITGTNTFTGTQTVNGDILLGAANVLTWGSTVSEPMLKRSGSALHARLGNDSAFTFVLGTNFISQAAGFIARSGVTITGGATGNVPTLTAGPVTGNPTKWMPIDDNGTTRYMPTW